MHKNVSKIILLKKDHKDICTKKKVYSFIFSLKKSRREKQILYKSFLFFFFYNYRLKNEDEKK